MIQLSAALVFGSMLAAGPAAAVTLEPESAYFVSNSHTGGNTPSSLSNTDTYLFDYSFPTVIGSPILDTTANLKVGTTSFTSLTLDWVLGSSSLIGGPQVIPLNSFAGSVDINLPLTIYGTYKLLFAWTVDKGKTGAYTSLLQTPPAPPGENIVPLP